MLPILQFNIKHALAIFDGNISFVLFHLFYDSTSCAADTLLADFADVYIAGFTSLALFIGNFRELHHDELTLTPVLSV